MPSLGYEGFGLLAVELVMCALEQKCKDMNPKPGIWLHKLKKSRSVQPKRYSFNTRLTWQSANCIVVS